CADCFTVNPVCLLAGSASVTPATCNGESTGSIDLSVTGSLGSESYAWSNGATTQDVSGLAAGNYTVTISEGSCSTELMVEVSEPDPLSLSVSLTDESVTGASDGSIDVTLTGGTPPYQYIWSNGETTEDLAGLTAGFYQFSVTDDQGCGLSTGNFEIQSGSCALEATSFITPLSCHGDQNGRIELNINGASGDVMVQWSNGAPDTTILDNLAAGTYLYTITDGVGCSVADLATLSDPDPIALSLSTSDILCGGDSTGTAAVLVSGTQGVYAVNWSQGSLGDSISNLVAGSYSITVMDELGCAAADTFIINENAPLVIEVDSVNPADGSIQVNVLGGVEPYSYAWWNDTAMVSTDEDLTGAAPGIYRLLVTDGLGCMAATDTIRLAETSARFSPDIERQVQVYPNPMRSRLQVRIPDLLIGSKAELFNALGQCIHTQILRDGLTVIERNELATGWYSLRIRQGDRQIALPVLIQD
ncbi:MAG: T9SS type A sorting domain-containing protein, partial [Saprospiraceae bacterium]|nr:T9SS type A sorting domain-containing protein [Saprospiraceae bacterium]